MKKRDIIIVTVSIAAAIVCIALTFWGNLKNNGAVTTDAFIGVLATLIGVCATIVVGFQIASFLELRELKKQVEQVEKQKEELAKYKQSVGFDIHLAKAGVANAFGILSVVEKDSLLGHASRTCSIICEDLQCIDGNVLLTRYQHLYDETVKWLQTDDYVDILAPTIHNLNYIEIPKTIAHYNEIMKIHFDILNVMNQAIARKNKKN